MQSINISFEFSIDDWIAFQENFQSNSKQFRKIKTIVTLMLPIGFIAYSIYKYIGNDLSYIEVLVYLLFSILWVVFYPTSFKKSSLKQARKMMGEGDNSALIGKHSIEFTDDYFFVEEPGSESKANWSAVNKIEENEKYIFIYITSVMACIIPKFKIGDKKEEVIEFIRSKTSNKE